MFDKLVELFVDSIKLFRLFIVIQPYEKGVIVRLGKFRRISEPGVVWVIPFGIDEVFASPAYFQTMTIGPQSLVTKDGREIVVSTLVTHFVGDHEKHFITISGGEQAIEDTAYGVVARFTMERTWDELHSEGVSRELTTLMRQAIDDYGVKVKRAQIIDLTRSRSIRLIQHIGNKLAVATKE